MKQIIRFLLLILLSATIAIAHGGEDHGEEKRGSSVPTGATPVTTRHLDRTVNTSDGQFKFLLTQSPSDPRNGEEVQFEVSIVELVEGGFAGGEVPVEDAKVTGQLKTISDKQISEPISAHKESLPGVYGIHYIFKDHGSFKIFIDVTTSDGRKPAVDFPIAISAAPIKYRPYLFDVTLLIAALSFIALRYRTALRSFDRMAAVKWTLPYALVSLALFAVSAVVVHYFIPATEPRVTTSVPTTSVASDPNILFIPKESQLVFGIRTQEVEQKRIISGVTVTGIVKVRPQFKAEVVPPVSGRTRAAGNFTIGSLVRQGQMLAVVEQVLSAPETADLESTRTELKAKTAELQAQAVQAQARRNAAQIELNRAKKLYNAGAAPLKRVQDAELQLQLSQQEVAAAQQQATITQVGEQRVEPVKTFPLRAPISGVIAESVFTPGEQVEAGKTLFTIMNLDRVWIEASVFEKDLAAITSAKSATFRVVAFPDEVFNIGENTTNRLLTVGARVDREKKTVPVVYEVNNPNGRLRDGMTAEITIDTTEGREVVSVPKAAVLDEQGKKMVYVFDGGEKFSKRAVTVGSQGQISIEILSGLKPGERVVVEGIYQLRSTAPGTST
ncbi:MAG: efflux RND transporter periplasmic adaptor subunit [Acidobacteriota bacterium]